MNKSLIKQYFNISIAWQNYILGHVSKCLNYDSDDEVIRKNAIANLTEELRLAMHLNLSGFMIPVRGLKLENLARVLNDFILNKFSILNILIKVPMCAESDTTSFIENHKDENNNQNELEHLTWRIWTKMRTLCEESSKLHLALELTDDLPSEEVINRWYGEPVRCIVLPTSIFLTNKNGFPVLSKAHQKIVAKFSQLRVDFIIQGTNRHQNKGYEKYVEYINYLYKVRKLINYFWHHFSFNWDLNKTFSQENLKKISTAQI